MISEDDYKAISQSLDDGIDITQEQARELFMTVIEIDARGVAYVATLKACIDTNAILVQEMTDTLMKMFGKNDVKNRNKAHKYSSQMAARYEQLVDVYLNESLKQVAQSLQGEEVTPMEVEPDVQQ